ncbi:MAG: polysaccharide biosynthesis/export family protein [Blastocatellia bacterium]
MKLLHLVQRSINVGKVSCGLICLLCGIEGAAAQSALPTPTASQAKTPANNTALPEDKRYRIGPGDLLSIQIFNRPQLSREAVRVDGRGMIQLPWIDDDIRVACHTEAEVAAEITARYRSLLRAPQVGVFVKEFQSQPVAVIGAVNQPGRYQLQRPVRLLELLTFAGGPAERAGRTIHIIHTAPVPFCEQETVNDVQPRAQFQAAVVEPTPETEKSEEQTALTALSLADVMRGGQQANPFVRPGDIVTLPEAEQVFVVGNVLRPAGFPLRGNVTVSQAIAMAGGLLPASKTDRIAIVRQTPTGKRELYVDLKAINRQQAEDIALQANDIVTVPTAGGKNFVRTIVGALAPAVVQLPIQVVR